MARNSYKISFKNSVVIYALWDKYSTVPTRVVEEYQIELLNHMLLDLKEASFSCTDEEFIKRLTPTMLRNYRKLRSNVFKIKKHEESFNVLAGG